MTLPKQKYYHTLKEKYAAVVTSEHWPIALPFVRECLRLDFLLPALPITHPPMPEEDEEKI